MTSLKVEKNALIAISFISQGLQVLGFQKYIQKSDSETCRKPSILSTLIKIDNFNFLIGKIDKIDKWK